MAERSPVGAGPTGLDLHWDDRQTEVVVDAEAYARLLEHVLVEEGATGPGEATLHFVERDEITELNRKHMGATGATDVLSFPVDGADPVDATGHRVVGDVVVCPGVAAAQAHDHAGEVGDEITLLVVHGGLHLCGHDHAEPDEHARMWARERELLERWWRPLSADPWAES